MNGNIAEDGKRTRFGEPGGADPRRARARVATHPATVRASLRRLMAYPIEPDQPLRPQLSHEKLLTFLSRGHPAPTLGMLAAVQLYQHSFGSGSLMIQLINQVDGKLGTRRGRSGELLGE